MKSQAVNAVWLSDASDELASSTSVNLRVQVQVRSLESGSSTAWDSFAWSPAVRNAPAAFPVPMDPSELGGKVYCAEVEGSSSKAVRANKEDIADVVVFMVISGRWSMRW